MHLTGTGLTHLGSAATRDSMHKKTAEAAEETLTDSMKMFRMGLEGGKPTDRAKKACSRNGSTRAMARRRSPQARSLSRRPLRWMAARSRKWPASMSSAKMARHSASALRFPTNFPIMSPSGSTIFSRPFQAQAGKLRTGNPYRRTAGRYSRDIAHSPRRHGDLRKALPVRRGQHVPHFRQP